MFSPTPSPYGATLSSSELVQLALALQREPSRERAIEQLGKATVVPPRSPYRTPSRLVDQAGATFLDAFIEHPELTAGWHPLTETIFPWKLSPAHLSMTTTSPEQSLFRLWRADYHGPLGTLHFEILPSGQLRCSLAGELEAVGRMLEHTRGGLRYSIFPEGLNRILARVALRPELIGMNSSNHPSPYIAQILLPGDLSGAATIGNIFQYFFDQPLAPESSLEFEEMRWPLSTNPSKPCLLHLSA